MIVEPAARAAAPPRSASQYQRAKAMTLASQIAPPAISSLLASSVNGLKGVVGGDQDDDADGHSSEPDDLSVDAAGIADDQHPEEHHHDHQVPPPRVAEELGRKLPQLDREYGVQGSGSQYRQGHRPPRLAGPVGPLATSHFRLWGLGHPAPFGRRRSARSAGRP